MLKCLIMLLVLHFSQLVPFIGRFFSHMEEMRCDAAFVIFDNGL